MASEEKWETGTVNLKIGKSTVEMQLTVPKEPVRARRMLPVFRQMANSVVKSGVEEIEKEGKQISCKAGCGACCRQMVPISEIEAFEIAELVENMEEPRRTEVKKRFDDAAKHFFEIGWFERFEAAAFKEVEDRKAVINEYFFEGIPCPFLENESCSIHENRPLICREYLVSSPSELCSNPFSPGIDTITFAIKPSVPLRDLANSKKMKSSAINFMPLILSIEWAKNCEESQEEKPGREWAGEFFNLLSKKGGSDDE